MPTDIDHLEVLSEALDQTEGLIARVRPDQAGLPTPCPDWDVRALVNHVVDDVRMFTARASGEAWQQGQGDLIGDDWTGAYRRAADGLLAAWRRDGALDRTVKLPFGEVPATWMVGQAVADLVVHGWDVATATSQRTDLDPELGEYSLEWGRRNLKPEYRGDAFGPEVPVPDDAPLYDRVAGFFGRRP